MAALIVPGTPVPEIVSRNQDGKAVRLSDFIGKPVLIFFYPKDDTPGCTREVCSFRDDYAQFTRLGAVIVGISHQGEASHQAFRKKFNLPFDLWIDEDGSLARALGVEDVPLIGRLFGLHKRQSVLIGPDGRLVRMYEKVDPEKHSKEVLDDLAKLESSMR